jgi:hypothetical protein
MHRLGIPPFLMRLPWIAAALLAAAAHPRPSVASPLQFTSPDGRRRVDAVEAATPIVLDGVLDEEAWRGAPVADGFVQAEPQEGAPASEATEVRLVFDREALYLGVTCHDREPDAIIVNDIRKDFATPGEQDTFSVLLDTFGDRRNGFVFTINAAGAKADTQIANEGRDVNVSWDAVWSVRARRQPFGWTAEIRIPFKTLRFERGAGRTWGINFSRRVRRRNETDYWSAVPRVYNLYRASLAGDLHGLPDVSQGRNLRVKPYVLASTVRGTGRPSFEREADMGLDVKYGVTPALTLDVTANPDFAQAEADEQQVNLTRFSLFYPEKREFFLENAGVFYLGDIARESRNVTTRFSPPEEELLLFFSRRIGLTEAGEPIPIAGGLRLTGRARGFGLGAMSIQTRPGGGRGGDNYSVVRVRRDVLGSSDIGAIFLSRVSAASTADRNQVAGVDANFRFRRALSINTFVAKSDTPGLDGNDWTGKASISWNDNVQHWQYSFLTIGDDFRDDLGFVRRRGIRKHFVDSGVRPRPAALRRRGIRELHPHARLNEYTDHDNRLVTRQDHVGFSFFFENGGIFEYAWNPKAERIDVPFELRRGTVFLPGRYDWNEYELTLQTDQSRALAASIRLTNGGFWNGTQNSQRLAVVLRPSYHLLVDVAWQRNDLAFPAPLQSFTTNLLSARLGYAFTTQMFLDSLLQYNRDLRQFNANVRFNLIHRPLSDLFVVYNEQRFATGPTPPGRGLVVKYTHMLAF